MESPCSKLELKRTELKESEMKLTKACNQIVLLNKQLQSMKFRFNRAKGDNFLCFRYNLRLKLSVIEGVRRMYYKYAEEKADTIATLLEDLAADDENVDV